MKKILVLLLLFFPTLAFAQTSRNPCFLNGQQSTNGIPSCQSVSNSAPLPVTGTVIPQGGSNFTTSQVSIATSSTAAVASRPNRISVTITNITGTQQIYCSGATATASNGQLIPAVVGANYTASTAAAINCIALVGAQTISVAEIY